MERIAELHREFTEGLEYQAGIMEVLAEAVLEAHKDKGHCKGCPHYYKIGTDPRCKGGGYDCCKCPACGVARKVLVGGHEDAA